jgi:hypothetical protein
MSFYSEKGGKKTPFHLFHGCLKDFPFDLGQWAWAHYTLLLNYITKKGHSLFNSKEALLQKIHDK